MAKISGEDFDRELIDEMFDPIVDGLKEGSRNYIRELLRAQGIMTDTTGDFGEKTKKEIKKAANDIEEGAEILEKVLKQSFNKSLVSFAISLLDSNPINCFIMSNIKHISLIIFINYYTSYIILYLVP